MAGLVQHHHHHHHHNGHFYDLCGVAIVLLLLTTAGHPSSVQADQYKYTAEFSSSNIGSRSGSIGSNSGDTRPSRPNIVFIMADDMGFNDVGYHNRKQVHTPTIDRLASHGVRLENYYVQPVCSPTRSQFMSGRSQIHTGLQHKIIRRTQPSALPRDSPTLADKMHESGYSTDMVGKWHLGFYKEEYTPTHRGFDSFYGMYLGSGGYYSHRACHGRKCAVDLHNDTRSGGRKVDFGQAGVHSTKLFTDQAVRIIRDRSAQPKPFFLYLSYQAVHGPLQVPEVYKKLIRKKLRRRRVVLRNKKRLTCLAQGLAMDHGIARVVKALKQSGVWNNTVLVFSTDNGGTPKVGGSNTPLRGGKGSYFEGGVRGVSFVSSPLLERKGYVNNQLIHVTDWFPTFVSLANGNLSGTRDVLGFDQWKTVSQGSQSPRKEILYNIDPRSRSRRTVSRPRKKPKVFDTSFLAAMRKGDFKIITGARQCRDHICLFNIKTDPREKKDLSGLTSYKSKVSEMLERLRDHQKTAVPVQFPRSMRLTFPSGAWEPWM